MHVLQYYVTGIPLQLHSAFFCFCNTINYAFLPNPTIHWATLRQSQVPRLPAVASGSTTRMFSRQASTKPKSPGLRSTLQCEPYVHHG